MSETRGEAWSPPKRLRWSPEDGRRMVEAFRLGGDSVEEFASNHGLVPERVRRWLRRSDKPTVVGVPFAPVAIVLPRGSGASGGGIEVVVGEVLIRVGRGFDDEVLRGVLAVVGSRC